MNAGFAWPIIALTVVTGRPYSVSQTDPAECRRLCHERRPSSASSRAAFFAFVRPLCVPLLHCATGAGHEHVVVWVGERASDLPRQEQLPQLGEQGHDPHARVRLRRLRAPVGEQTAADGDRIGLEVYVAPLKPPHLTEP